MKRKFTEVEALSLVSATKGITINSSKRIVKDCSFQGFKGLTTCSASDYLINYCGYKG